MESCIRTIFTISRRKSSSEILSRSLGKILLVKILHREHSVRVRALRSRLHQMKSPILPIDILAHEHRGKSGRAETQQISYETGTGPAPETDFRVDRLGEVLRRPVMVASERIPVLPATGLIDTAVHVKVDMTARLDFALNEGVRVQHVDELGVARVELLVLVDGDEERHRRIEAGDPRELVRP